jgi:hypothetical protein
MYTFTVKGLVAHPEYAYIMGNKGIKLKEK